MLRVGRGSVWVGAGRCMSSEDSPSVTLPRSVDTVICGGGILGASIALHLAEKGVKDIILLEQGRSVHRQYGGGGGGIMSV